MIPSNAVRWRPNDRRGHVESFFLKANAPGEGRAIWLRFTLLVPRALPETARAEVWAMAFDRRAGVPRAWKATAPAGAATLAPERLGFAVLGCELAPGRTHGKIPGAMGDIAWDLRWTGRGDELRLLPTASYGRGGFPRTKLVSPEPDARFDGSVSIADQRWNLQAWPGMQGHNWGRGHATRYAWAHCNAFAHHTGDDVRGSIGCRHVRPMDDATADARGAAARRAHVRHEWHTALVQSLREHRDGAVELPCCLRD
jgi:hypothetical protein